MTLKADPPPDPGPTLQQRFRLGSEITPEQRDFLGQHGFLHFRGVASPEEVAMIASEVEAIEARWLEEGRTRVYGIPLFFGRNPEGRPWVQRLAFASMFSERIRAFVRDERFEAVRRLIGEDARIGDDEKDGVVVNRYLNAPKSVYRRLGWHTDGLRDLFYGRMPQEQLNVGLHLDRCRRDDGGLRLIPGSHTQGFWSMAFRKAYFVSHKADPDEVCVETEPGDLTVHDGRLWHRVARSSRNGPASLRRSMYVPYLTGPYEPKDENSPTPLYHRIGDALRRGAGHRAPDPRG